MVDALTAAAAAAAVGPRPKAARVRTYFTELMRRRNPRMSEHSLKKYGAALGVLYSRCCATGGVAFFEERSAEICVFLADLALATSSRIDYLRALRFVCVTADSRIRYTSECDVYTNEYREQRLRHRAESQRRDRENRREAFEMMMSAATAYADRQMQLDNTAAADRARRRRDALCQEFARSMPRRNGGAYTHRAYAAHLMSLYAEMRCADGADGGDDGDDGTDGDWSAFFRTNAAQTCAHLEKKMGGGAQSRAQSRVQSHVQSRVRLRLNALALLTGDPLYEQAYARAAATKVRSADRLTDLIARLRAVQNARL